MNRVFLKGALGRDPKILMTQDGREIASLCLATSFPWKAYTREGEKPGEWATHTDWHRVTVFRKPTVSWIKACPRKDDLGNGLKKGDMLYVEGKLSYHQWEDKYGQNRFTPHIVVTGQEGCIEYLRSKKSKSSEDSGSESPTVKKSEEQDENALARDFGLISVDPSFPSTSTGDKQ